MFRTLLLLYCFLLPANLSAASTDRHILLITIDGFAAYNLDDDSLVIPNIRQLQASGVRTAGSETIFPSVTHPSHTTILTGVTPGKHGVLGNTMYDRTTGKAYSVSNRPRAEAIHVPTIFDAAKQHGFSTASFFWPETRGDQSIDYNMPEILDDERALNMASLSGPFIAELRAAGLPLDLFPKYYDDPELHEMADLVLAESAAFTIRTHKPNLLAIHFLATDKAQHKYGPGSYLAKAAITQTDRRIGILRQAVKDAGIEDSTTWIVGADHGFQAVYQDLNLDPLFREAGLVDRLKISPDKWVLHIARGENFNEATDGPRLEQLLAKIAARPGIERVIASADYPKLGWPRYEDDIHVRGEYMVIANMSYHLVMDPSSSSLAPRMFCNTRAATRGCRITSPFTALSRASVSRSIRMSFRM